MDEKRFPIQGGVTISWKAAERAYLYYEDRFGKGQTIERLAERGGFGFMEFICLYYKMAPWSGTKPTEEQIVRCLSDSDIRSRFPGR